MHKVPETGRVVLPPTAPTEICFDWVDDGVFVENVVIEVRVPSRWRSSPQFSIT